MDSSTALILVIHIIGGGLAMLAGFTNMAMKKATLLHKRIGGVYIVALIANAFTSIILSIKINNSILGALGILTLYLIVSGIKYLSLRKRVQHRRLTMSDWLPTILLFSYSAYLIVDAFLHFNDYNNNSAIYLLIIAALSLFMVWQDVAIFKGLVKKDNFHQTMHLQRMIPSFIVLLISFLMVNSLFLPIWASFLLPIVSIFPFMIIWTKKYSKSKLTDRMLH